MIPDDSVVLMIGEKGTGKLSLIKDLLWHKQRFPVGTVISGTEGANAFYSTIIPSLFIHDEFNTAIISNVLKRQDIVTKQILSENDTLGVSTLDRRAFIVMDDCMCDTEWINDKFIRSLFMNGRYYGLLSVFATESLPDFHPILRRQIDYIFISRESSIVARHLIYEQFTGFFPTFDFFCDIMDQCTKDDECLVIHNGAKTSKIEDCVFWYKPVSRPDFKIGSKEQWIKSAEYDRQKEVAAAEAAAADEETTTALTMMNTEASGSILQLKNY